jgi:predicted nucleic acid-binding protein
LILKTVEAGRYRLITSPVHEIEISDIANDSERIDLLLMLEKLGVRIAIDNEAARARAEKLFRQGLGPADAAHIAFAEAAQADFISCDDKLVFVRKRLFFPDSSLLSKFNPRNITHMPAVKFIERLDS